MPRSRNLLIIFALLSLIPASASGQTASSGSASSRYLRNFDTSAIIERYNNNMAMSVLADFIVLGHNNRYGSFALAGSKTHMFGSA